MKAMILKEFRQMARDRRTVALMVGLPIMLLVIFGYAARYDVANIDTIVVGPDAAAVAANLDPVYSVATVDPSGTRATAEEALRFAELARERALHPGVMIEVPAAALLADKILQHVEFLSIGTNDLAQYTMAADRMSSDLATLTDPWQPGVLALVAKTARAGQATGKPVGVCGEAAADPLLACVLTGLGVTSLSAAASAVALVGAKLASVTLQQCRDAAEAVLATAGAAEAREVAQAVLG